MQRIEVAASDVRITDEIEVHSKRDGETQVWPVTGIMRDGKLLSFRTKYWTGVAWLRNVKLDETVAVYR